MADSTSVTTATFFRVGHPIRKDVISGFSLITSFLITSFFSIKLSFLFYWYVCYILIRCTEQFKKEKQWTLSSKSHAYYSWPPYLSSLYNWHFLKAVAITLIRVWLWLFHLDPLTPKIWLVTVLSGWFTCYCTLVKRIWVYINSASSSWYICLFSSPFC